MRIKYRWLNPWNILGDFILIAVTINLILTLLEPKYGFIASLMNFFILIPIQAISYFILARKWREKNKKILLEWVEKEYQIDKIKEEKD